MTFFMACALSASRATVGLAREAVGRAFFGGLAGGFFFDTDASLPFDAGLALGCCVAFATALGARLRLGGFGERVRVFAVRAAMVSF